MNEDSMTQSKRLMYLPEGYLREQSGNTYTELMVNCWRRAGYEPVAMPRGRRQKLDALRQRSRTVGVMNWVDNCIIGRDGRFSPTGLWMFAATVLKLHLVCSKVVFVRHNVFPHAARGRSQGIAKVLIDWSERLLFDEVLVHSRHYTGGHRRYVPHPTFDFDDAGLPAGPSDDMVYFGSIVRYKNLEGLIDAWKRPSRLLIAGGCGDTAYLDSLKARAAGKNIAFVPGRLDDAAAQRLLRTTAAAIIPHAGPDMIISGSLYFALSCGVPAICCGLEHARSLTAEGVPGVVVIESLEALNGVDTGMLQRLDRREIAAAAKQHFGPEVVTRLITQFA
jgi:beta-1,4-mannosyltransferase